uniref:N-acetyltransferase domain-containing protein n=1 Tax=Mycena chlorophos TaxID=658473 RepID=A0ABQ0M897_MYCCL|nr:predicted protein [Mycena chlorophos]
MSSHPLSMANISPLQLNPTTNEPFLRLLTHPNITITPPRPTDGARHVEMLNDPRVYPFLSSPPYPYALEHAKWWLDRAIPLSEKLMAELESDSPGPLDGCPVTYIREIQKDGSDLLIGTIVFRLSDLPFELKPYGLTPEDNRDVWTVGFYLASSHHGQGIMSDALNTVLTQWAIPRMGVRKMVVNAHEGNTGSVRVFDKLGFKLRAKSEDAVVDTRGVATPVHVLDWEML